MPVDPDGDVLRRQLEAYVLAFPTNLAPVVGQQITVTASSGDAVDARVRLLRARADAGDCDLGAKTYANDDEVGYLYVGAGACASDRRTLAPIAESALRAQAKSAGRAVTYTCVPPGSGQRIGVDRDGDGVWDGDERYAGSDPGDAASML